MVRVTYSPEHECLADESVGMHNLKVNMDEATGKIKYRIIKVKNRVRKPSSDCSGWIWTDEEHYECQELEEHFFSKDIWKTMIFHDENTEKGNGLRDFDDVEEIRNWLVALDGDRIEEVKLYKEH